MVVEGLAEAGCRHPESDEHRGEREAEEQRRAEHPRPATPVLDVRERDARDRRQVAGHERQHAGGDERDEADGKGGHDRGVDGVGGDHRS